MVVKIDFERKGFVPLPRPGVDFPAYIRDLNDLAELVKTELALRDKKIEALEQEVKTLKEAQQK